MSEAEEHTKEVLGLESGNAIHDNDFFRNCDVVRINASVANFTFHNELCLILHIEDISDNKAHAKLMDFHISVMSGLNSVYQ